MALIETESLVLKSYNLAEADRIVVLLTQDHGVVRGVAKGAKRLKSKFGSGLEPFSIVQASYFEKEAVELVTIQRIDLVRSNFAAASQPDFLQKFSYLCDLLIAFSPPHDPNQTLYRMAKTCIETAVADPSALLSTGVYFEIWLLKLSGFLPDWRKCGGCDRSFDETEQSSMRADFHFVCDACRRSSHNRIIGDSGRTLAISALKISPSAFAATTSHRSDELNRLTGMLKALFSRSMGKEIAGEKSLASRSLEI